jgi:predicted permease
MENVNLIFLLSLSIIAIGFILKKLNIIKENDGKVIAKIILNVTLPSLILNVISSIDLSLDLLFFPIIIIIYSLSLSTLILYLFRKNHSQVKGLMLMTVIGYNIGNFAYPLIGGVFGLEGIRYLAMWDAGNAFIIFGLCYMYAEIFSPVKDSEQVKLNPKLVLYKLLKSVPLMSYVIALLLNISGIGLPFFIADVVEILANANMALTLLLLGILLNFSFPKNEWKEVGKILMIRYVIGFAIGILLFIILPFGLLYRTILLIGFILPIGLAIVPFSIEFKHNEKVANMLVNLSIIISFGLMWLIILILNP